MITAQTLLDQIAAQRDTLRQFGVVRMGIFGSVARGEATEKSDIDLLVDYDPKKLTYRNYYGTITYLEQLLKRPIDLVTSDSISPYIKPHVLKEVKYVEITH